MVSPVQLAHRPWTRRVERRDLLRSRVAADSHVLLALSLVVPVILGELIHLDGGLAPVVAASALLVASQALIAAGRGRITDRVPPRTLSMVRLLLALGFVAAAVQVVSTPIFRPSALYLPVIALAATIGTEELLGIAAVAAALYIAPLISTPADIIPVMQRGFVLAAVATVLALGTRRTVVALERALARSVEARQRDRRRNRQIAALETIGSRLAKEGPTEAALEEIVDTLSIVFEYPFVAVYLGDRTVVRLAAQRGYGDLPAIVGDSVGVIGRVMRSGQPAFVPDVSAARDYVAGSAEVGGEICVPLVAEGAFRGVLNVEVSRGATLERQDLASLTIVADRLASSIALGERHADAVARARLFERLTAFSQSIAAAHGPDELFGRIVEHVGSVIANDSAALTLRDLEGTFRIVAAQGDGAVQPGAEVRPGEGMTGRALAEKTLIVSERGDGTAPSADEAAADCRPARRCSIPLIGAGVVLGALDVDRTDAAAPFSSLEREAMPIIAAHVALALANARPTAELAEQSIRDPLTGLFNRRHLDATIDRLDAARSRLTPTQQRPLAAIMFDLDHFGSVNRLHGHRVGDEVLRQFARTCSSRFRAADVLGRYGGEEFLAVLDGATREDAVQIANEIRAAFEAVAVVLPSGDTLTCTVSAGCAAIGPDAVTMEALVETADVGLQVAKRAGRNQVVAA